MTLNIDQETLKRHKRKRNESDREYRARVAKINASARYSKKYIRQLTINLNKKSDSNLIDFYNYIPKIYGTTRAAFFKNVMQTEYEKYQDVIHEYKMQEVQKANDNSLKKTKHND